MRRGFLLPEVPTSKPNIEASIALINASDPLTAWAKYLTSESIYTMCWAIGEVYIRENDPTPIKLKNHWSRVSGGFHGLLLLGKQGNLSKEQFWSLYGPNTRARGPLSELYIELPQPTNRQQTVRNLADLRALITPELSQELKHGKYCGWFDGNIDVLVTAIWCIGGLVSQPLGTEFTAEQKQYSDILYLLHSRYARNAEQIIAEAKVKAQADFARAYSTL